MSAASEKPAPLSRSGVVDAIRQRILQGDLVPGQRLVEAELCELLNTSRGTVRSVLIELEHEGLIERIANRGARVRVVSLDEALQIAEVRLAVESIVVARAAERITDKQIATLRKLAKTLDDRAAASDVEGYAEATQQVFEYYLGVADHPVAAEVLERLRARNSRHRYRLTYRAGRARVSVEFWRDIVNAICERNPGAAQKALRRLVRNVEDSMKAIAQDHTPFAIIYS